MVCRGMEYQTHIQYFGMGHIHQQHILYLSHNLGNFSCIPYSFILDRNSSKSSQTKSTAPRANASGPSYERPSSASSFICGRLSRSEERRVGKECRSQWS